MATVSDEKPIKVVGYMPADTPPLGAMLSLGFQQVLTMFPATILVALLTKFDVGVTLLASGVGTIIALLVARRKIPMYYGSSFSYIAVVITVMSLYANDCFSNPATTYCPAGVRIVQVGILGTAIVEILIGLLIMRVGKAALDKVLPPIITGCLAIVIGIALAGTALNNAGTHWPVAFITLLVTVGFSVYLNGKGLLGMLPILFGAIVGYGAAAAFGIIDYSAIATAHWVQAPRITLPAFEDPRAWGAVISIALIAIATVPESTAHLYQMSLYIDALANELKRPALKIKELIGLNLVADGADDLVVGMLGGCAGTNYGENNSLMAITRNYSVPVLMTAGVMAILLGFIGKLAALVQTIPTAVVGGLSIYLFGVIGMQGVALIQSEKVNLFEPRQLAVGAIILVSGIGGSIALPNGLFPFVIPGIFPNGIPAIVFSAILGILINLVFVLLPPSLFGVKERENLNV
ncbi:xanthine/uracil permease [Longilinea arvoryzae]|uniref:Xanthine/uracil permease n=1 Tax=Longilinea arvoryzae TaxID=360412 RepID=A0A0K8MXQ5_9CHLR|nr:solute carrier family 23 protein [Longilinea arvoryzae]GAP15985.1 xanthine/uracil permease [Longilinea arvoryzae]